MNNRVLNKVILLSVIVSTIPVVVYLIQFASLKLSPNKADWGAFGDYIGGLIEPFLSFLTLLVTAYIAISINDYEKQKSKELKIQDDVKTYLEIYQYFTSAEFKEKRLISWNVMRKAMIYPEYGDFLIEGGFVSRYIDRDHKRNNIYNKYGHIFYKDLNLSQEQFLQQESDDRHKLESVIDFFQVLAIKDVPNENYKVCDFYYDNWRPFLCWYAKKAEELYCNYDINKQFNTPPNLREAIQILDKKLCSPLCNVLSIEDIMEHPILKFYSGEVI